MKKILFPSLILAMIVSATPVFAKTENPYRGVLYIDKCVLVKDAFWVEEPEFNRYSLLVQCADFDEMQSYARGSGRNFPVFTFSMFGVKNREFTRTINLNQDRYRQGAVWHFRADFRTYNETMWERIHGWMRAKPSDYKIPYENQPFKSSPPLPTFSEYITTVNKLISGNW